MPRTANTEMASYWVQRHRTIGRKSVHPPYVRKYMRAQRVENAHNSCVCSLVATSLARRMVHTIVASPLLLLLLHFTWCRNGTQRALYFSITEIDCHALSSESDTYSHIQTETHTMSTAEMASQADLCCVGVAWIISSEIYMLGGWNGLFCRYTTSFYR